MLTHETNTPQTEIGAPETKKGVNIEPHAAEALSGILNSSELAPFDDGVSRYLVEQVDTWLHQPVSRYNKSVYDTLNEIFPPPDKREPSPYEFEFHHIYGGRVLAQNDLNGINIVQTAAEHCYPTMSFNGVKLVVSHSSGISPHEALNGANYIVGGHVSQTTLESAVGFRRELMQEMAEIACIGHLQRLDDMDLEEARLEAANALYGFAGLFDTEPSTVEQADELLYNNAGYCRVSDYLDWLLHHNRQAFAIDRYSHVHFDLKPEQVPAGHPPRFTYEFDLCHGGNQPGKCEAPRMPLLQIGRNHSAKKLFGTEKNGSYKVWRIIDNADYEGVSQYKSTVRRVLNIVANTASSFSY